MQALPPPISIPPISIAATAVVVAAAAAAEPVVMDIICDIDEDAEVGMDIDISIEEDMIKR